VNWLKGTITMNNTAEPERQTMNTTHEYFVDKNNFNGECPEGVTPGCRFVSDTPEVIEELHIAMLLWEEWTQYSGQTVPWLELKEEGQKNFLAMATGLMNRYEIRPKSR
jgi:hypothetical protein